MKGIILAGGFGSRLSPLTKATNKHLLPIYDKPMIFYPLETLKKAGIKEVMVIVSGPHSGDFISILKNGEEFGFDRLSYGYQEKPDGGIADALSIAEYFANKDNICVVLGDNTTNADISENVKIFESRKRKVFIPTAHLFLKAVSDPERYGIAETDEQQVLSIEEKPEFPKTNLAVTGLYLYDFHVFNFIKKCKPSDRGELEITDVNNFYIKKGYAGYSNLKGFWKDAGTFDSLYEANRFWAENDGR